VSKQRRSFWFVGVTLIPTTYLHCISIHLLLYIIIIIIIIIITIVTVTFSA